MSANPKLFTSLLLPLSGITLKNRMVVSPMCQYSAENGYANDWHLVHLGSRAVGGAAAVIQEATAVTSEGRISYGDLGLWEDGHIDNLKRITAFIKEQGAIPGIQLAHAGRKASTEKPWLGGGQIKSGQHHWQTMAPSAIPFASHDDPPSAMDLAAIQHVVNAFAEAARRAVEAGYQIVEIHAAHGYLIHQFLSPVANQRNDKYGGVLENRIRLLTEVVQAIKSSLPQQVSLWVRISATDWLDEGGWDLQQSLRLTEVLKELGVELIDVSSGGMVPHATIPLRPGYQVPFAEQLKQQTGILTGAVGLINEAEQAEEVIASGQADLVLMARALLRDPYFPLHAAQALGADVSWPPPYARAQPKMK